MSHHRMHPYNMNSRPQPRPQQHPPAEETDLPAPEMPDIEDEVHFDRIPDQPEEKPQEKSPEQAPETISLEEARAQLEDQRLRMAAEMDNFKKRLDRDYQEQKRYAAEKVLSDLLPALDNLDLALQYGTQNEACRDLMQGIDMTRKQLLDAVAKSGLATVGETGEQFDPAIHEAIGVAPDENLPKGAVSRVMQRGYKLNDRLLRPAKVMVNN